MKPKAASHNGTPENLYSHQSGQHRPTLLAKWQKTEDGYQVTEYSCPYISVGQKHAEICSIDKELMITHKDILNDEDNYSLETYDYSPIELGMSCELQVQRLTAQLTAAYHRIAALEEQLLAKRSLS